MNGELKQLPIGSLPAPDASAPGTMSAEELAKILARARAETAETVVTVGEAQRQREEREVEEREALEQWYTDQRAVRALLADARAQRGAGNVAFGCGAAVVGAGTLAGFMIGGPVGALVGGGLGWLADHLRGGTR